jgi:hypothetical protein
MKITKQITANTIKQLIDLNGDCDKINFSLDVNIQSKYKNPKPFQAVVITQQTLDSTENFNYQDVPEGIMNIHIDNNKGIKENYYLLIKSSEENNIEIQINIEDMPLSKEIQNEQERQQQQQRQTRIE